MYAYHYSDKLFKILKPQKPKHSYTKSYAIPILYLYKNRKDREFYIPNSYLYVCKIKKSELFDLKKFKGIVVNIDEFLIDLKKKGWKGIIDDNKIYYFYPLTPIKIFQFSE